ncbi:DNA-(apurinic or apyrimidinic site) endonuclease 2-like [Saccoglossus kowalevskii]|uniref:DNA-(apurinic or apyrimidinic site) endonuclease n=1 Tax=Saccoglossus kowalevskii TaxID=10224 RepID=A0ABM0GXS4_SACKO|nr:PREDICTED: DNA-(apurinic or apyrimidinic site) lyase 2-like [Saccoglossus kowalevskii]
MRILTWNINGIRAAKKPLKSLLDSLEADIICLQETKVTRDQLDEANAVVEGYNSYFSFSKGRQGYSGVATFCHNDFTPLAAEEGLSGILSSSAGNEVVGNYGNQTDFTDEELRSLDNEGRALLSLHKIKSSAGKNEDVVIINVYCPRCEPDDQERLNFKLRFYSLLQTRCEALLSAGRHVIVVGDMNVSHKAIDHCDAAVNPTKPRQWMDQFLCKLSDMGEIIDKTSEVNHLIGAVGISPEKVSNYSQSTGSFVDTFRHFHPQQQEAFTCWRTTTGARQLNYGTRIDYILASMSLQVELLDSIIMPNVEGSDHCPVKVTLRCTCETSKKIPTLSTKHMPEFAGKQQKLSGFFTKAAIESSHINTTPEIDSKISHPKLTNHYENCSASNLLKRTSSANESNATKKQKTTNRPKMHGNISDFFQKKSVSKTSDHPSIQSKDQVIPLECAISVAPRAGEDASHSIPMQSGMKDEKKKVAAKWKNMLSGPKPPPLCRGHKEPCVLRTVRKTGLNQGRQFYVCTKPEGPKSNPNARCDFFQWADKK